MTGDLFDTPAQALKHRDAVLNDIEQAHLAWFPKALRLIDRLRHEMGEMTGEAWRDEIEARMEPPRKPNCYGALINRAVKLGYLVHTGAYVPMLRKKAHGRETKVYRSGNGK
jgi:hypothetical protein